MLLLDTCTLLWLVADTTRFTETGRDLIIRQERQTFVSAITAFEIAIKHHKKKLRLPQPPDEWFSKVVDRHGLSVIPIDASIAIASALLPAIHNDPCDRIIIATAQKHRLKILTPDPQIRQYKGVEVVW